VALSLYVFGWGRLGSALGLQARASGWNLTGAWSRSLSAARRGRAVGVRVSRGRLAALATLPRADVWILAVPDDALSGFARQLADLRPPKGIVVAHLAGSLGLDPLAPLARAGVAIGSLHPFLAVAGPRTTLPGAACAIEGNRAAQTRLRSLARSLGMYPLRRSPHDRARYHLAASLLATSAVATAGHAESILRRAGVTRSEALPALVGLLRSVATNLEVYGKIRSLTGPLARGDLRRVAQQLSLLRKDALGLELYRVIGRLVLRERPGSARKRPQKLMRKLLEREAAPGKPG
jgi:predicted short-subunit dehydrogenase-like oxidoreductase (DUF2520 family)